MKQKAGKAKGSPKKRIRYSFLRILTGSDLSQRRPSVMSMESTEPGPTVWLTSCEHGVEKHFATRLSQDDFTITKPDPRYLHEITQRSHVRPCDCIMVGDRIDKDVIPAKQNGMGTVFVRTGIYRNQEPRSPEEVPDVTLDATEGLCTAIVNRWCR